MSHLRYFSVLSATVLICSLAADFTARADDVAVDISNVMWLAGTWTGVGDDGEMTGEAESTWTGPVEGVMSWTFRWHRAEGKHVHFAFSVVEESDDGVLLRGIHHGRNFDSFEDTNWTMRLVQADVSFARFVCVSNCRAASVEFTLLPNGSLKEAWRTNADAEPGFVINYR
jgi:hypothetical protein